MRQIITVLIFSFLFLTVCKKQEIEKNISIPYIVNVPALILREKPDTNSNKLDVLFKGKSLEVLEIDSKIDTINGIKGNWVKVKTKQNIEGYTFGAYIIPTQLKDNYTFQEDPLSEQYCKNIGNSYECSKKIERELLKTSLDIIRNENSLILNIDNEKELIFKDKDVKNDSCYYYNFRGKLNEINYSIIRIQFYEGSRFTLINNKNGMSVDTENFPKSISPDKKYLLILCDEIDYSFAGLQLINISNEKPEIEFQYESNWIPHDAQWIDNNIIELKVDSPFTNEHKFYSHNVRVKKINNKWTIEE
jgi:hypothetical protein